MSTLQHLFVYGTLAPNCVNHHMMLPIQDSVWQPATIRGYLMADGGWGSALGFPAVVPALAPDDSGDIVEGFVISSTDLVNHWLRLDAFEGESYQRIEVVATLASGEQVTAFVYALDNRQNY